MIIVMTHLIRKFQYMCYFILISLLLIYSGLLYYYTYTRKYIYNNNLNPKLLYWIIIIKINKTRLFLKFYIYFN